MCSPADQVSGPICRKTNAAGTVTGIPISNAAEAYKCENTNTSQLCARQMPQYIEFITDSICKSLGKGAHRFCQKYVLNKVKRFSPALLDGL